MTARGLSRARLLALLEGTSEDGPAVALILKGLIVASAILIALDTLPSLSEQYGPWMRGADEVTLFSVLALLMLYLAAVGINHLEHAALPEVFSSIPASLWWAIATLTTVGYGDSYPITVAGKIFTALILIIGLGIVAVPVALVTSALLRADEHLRKNANNSQGDDDDV